MDVIDHETYIKDVALAVECELDGPGFWTWTDPESLAASEQFDEDMENSGAGIAIWGYVERAEPGRAGAIAFPSGEALCWHEDEGWEWIDEDEDKELFKGKHATPKQLAKFVDGRIGA